VFLPWQIYISRAFPVESSVEYMNNTKHFFEVVEDHGGDALFYFNGLNKIYGEGQLVPYVILLSLFFFYKRLSENKFRVAFFSYLLIVYVFFSLAATKMLAFTFIVSPLIFLSLASFMETVLDYLKNKLFKREVFKNSFMALLMIVVAWANFNLYKIAYKHTLEIKPNDNDKRKDKINEAIFIKSLGDKLPSEDYVIFNCKAQKNIAIMFYTDCIAYDLQLDHQNYTALKNKGLKLAVINDGKLPAYLLNDASVIKIDAPDETWIRK